MQADTTDEPPTEAVGPLTRGLAVLRAVAAADGRASLGDLVRATGLARSTVDRVAATVARIGYARLDGRDVVLTPRLMELGNAYLSATGLPARLGGLADELADALDESVSLAVPDADGVRFVHQAIRRRTMALAFRIGDLVPAERAAPGPLFAAEWDDAAWRAWRRRRERDPDDAGFPAVPPPRGTAPVETFADRATAAGDAGWAQDDQFIEAGLVAVAVPVRDAAGRTVCALSVVSHTSRHDVASLREATLDALLVTAEAMRARLAAPVRATEPAGPIAPAGAADPVAPAANSADPGDAGPATSTATGGSGDPAPAVAAVLRASKRELGPEFVESFARGLAVIPAFDPEVSARARDAAAGRPVALPLTAVAEATGLPRATARRALITLEHLGYASHDNGLFRLTPRVLDLGFAHLSGLTLPGITEPHLVELVGKVHESASMAVLTDDDVQYIARVPTVRIMSVAISVGTRFPAYATSLGRVLLADLPEHERIARLARVEPVALTRHTVTSRTRLAAILVDTAERGFALVDEELEEGLRSIAVPVRDASGRAVAAVNVSMHASRRSPAEAEAALLPPLRAAAAAIEADLVAATRFAVLVR
ncbi:IclR family transcriptional regulator domain-containing protein [Streptodolium elevatio]|uniref:IclR family transcriptional regulator C-terminal domain-containing protein n=1 Tax=Streptodolium elevatio TaxID=3157996 RepID=A0ABV3DGG4_9ACTN